MYSFEKCFNNFLFRGTTPEEHIGMVVLYDFIPREPSQHFKTLVGICLCANTSGNCPTTTHVVQLTISAITTLSLASNRPTTSYGNSVGS